MDLISENKSFGGQQRRYHHTSATLNCDMNFSVYLPPQAQTEYVPVLYWLSGLTCTDENFVQKAGAQQYAARHGMIIVAPDTSPRGEDVPDDPDKAWDFGLGAGFYLNATQQPWTRHYQMYDYITTELTELVGRHFPVKSDRTAISGHSMGGHGALIIALKNPDIYQSVSAFAPICAPTQCAWGKKALSGYLGNDTELWRQYDTVELLATEQPQLSLLVDQGDSDEFLATQLKPDLLRAACDKYHHPLQLRLQQGYDHSYFFIASFIGEHIAFHANNLK